MHMKMFAPLLAVALLASLLTSGCVLQEPNEDRSYSYPESYEASMDEVRTRIVRLDTLVDRRRFDDAQREAFILENLTNKLHTQVPARAGEVERDLGYSNSDYHARVDDLQYAATWLHYFIKVHAHSDALDKVDLFIERYNRLALTFGPIVDAEDVIPTPERSTADYGVSDRYMNVRPDERLLYEGVE